MTLVLAAVVKNSKSATELVTKKGNCNGVNIDLSIFTPLFV